jgi:hypothetical protein
MNTKKIGQFYHKSLYYTYSVILPFSVIRDLTNNLFSSLTGSEYKPGTKSLEETRKKHKDKIV